MRNASLRRLIPSAGSSSNTSGQVDQQVVQLVQSSRLMVTIAIRRISVAPDEKYFS